MGWKEIDIAKCIIKKNYIPYTYVHELFLSLWISLKNALLTRAIQSGWKQIFSSHFIVGASLLLKRVNIHTKRSHTTNKQQLLHLHSFFCSTSPFCYLNMDINFIYFISYVIKITVVHSLMLFDSSFFI